MMNFSMIKLGIRSAARGIGFFMKRNAPTILVGTGIAGFVGTVVVGCKATLKTEDILEERDKKLQEMDDAHSDENQEYTDADYEADRKALKKKIFWKLVKNYAPTAALGTASAALILTGHHISGRRLAATAAAYKALETGFLDYRERVAEEFGQEAEERIRDGLKVDSLRLPEKTAEGNKADTDETKKSDRPTYGENCFWFSRATASVWVDDPEANLRTLMRIQRFAEDRLITQGFLFVNDILYDLGMEQTGWGSTHGWLMEDGKAVNVSLGLEFVNDTDIRRFLERRQPDTKLIFNCESAPINSRVDRARQKHKRAQREFMDLFRNRDNIKRT